MDHENASQLSADLAAADGLAIIAGIALLVLVAFAIAFLPTNHRLQNLLAPLTRRLAATIGAGIMMAPIANIPGAIVPFDFAALGFLGWFWWSFVSNNILADRASARRTGSAAGNGSPAADTVDVEPSY